MSEKGRVKWSKNYMLSLLGQIVFWPFDERSEPGKLCFPGHCPKPSEEPKPKWSRKTEFSGSLPEAFGRTKAKMEPENRVFRVTARSLRIFVFGESAVNSANGRKQKYHKEIIDQRVGRVMPENKNLAADGKRKRIQRLKKSIILMLMLAIMVPIVLCIVLFVKVLSLNKTLIMLSSQVEGLAWTVAEQQQELEELVAELRLNRKAGAVVTNRPVSSRVHLDHEETALPEPDQPEDSEQPLHRVYLTFDDGPSIYTDDILEILDKYDVKATFFVVGKESDAEKEALTMIVDGGHTLGMHSFSHKYAELYESVEDFAEDFVKLQSYLYEVTGVESKFYRFPGGSSNTVSDIDMQEFADYLESQGVQFYDWNISSGDGGSTLLSVDTLVRNCTAEIRENDVSIILFHDSSDKRTTVEALPRIIENILAMEDTVILPITEETVPVQHIN